MAVAAADFYTYARATGTPLPKTKQEEAKIAPAVDKWKRSRTKAPERQEDSNAIRNVLGTGAIAAGLAGAAAYGYRRGWGDTPGRPGDGPTPKGSPSPVTPGGDLPSDIPARLYKDDQRGVQVGKQGNLYRTQPVDIKEQPQVQTQFQNQALEDLNWDLAYSRARQEGLSDADAVIRAKEVVGQPIRKDYTPGPETDHRKEVANWKLSSPINPRAYIEKTGAIEPTVQVTKTETLNPWDAPFVRQGTTSVTNVDTPKDVLALPAAPTYIDTTSPEQLYVQKKLAELQTGPKALESLADEQIDVIRGTVANSKLYPDTTSEVRRQEARMRKNDKIAKQDLDEVLSDISDRKTWKDRTIDTNRILTTPPLKTGSPIVDSLVGNLPSAFVAADEIARRGVTDVGDVLKRAQRKIFYNADGSVKSVPEFLPGGQWLLDDYKRQEKELLGMEFPDDTLVEQQKSIKQGLSEQTLESANSGYEQMDDAFDRSVQRDTDSIAVGSDVVEVEKTQQALLQQAKMNNIAKREMLMSKGLSEQEAERYMGKYMGRESKEVTDLVTKVGEEDALPDKTSLRSISNVGDVFTEGLSKDEYEQLLDKAESGGAIRGRSRIQSAGENLYDTGRIDPYTGKIIKELDLDAEDQGGIGIYGWERQYAGGPVAKTDRQSSQHGLIKRGQYTSTARRKPTADQVGKFGSFNPTTERDEFRGYSNEALRKRIATGTFRSGKVSPGARAAQKELDLRKDLAGDEWERSNAKNYVPSTEKAKKSMEISRDIQNIYNSGRPDAQQQVQAYIQGLRQGQQF